MNANITAGARITVRRINSFGKLHFSKVGQAVEVQGALFHFQEAVTGRRVWLTVNPAEIGQVMRGWTQSYEVA